MELLGGWEGMAALGRLSSADAHRRGPDCGAARLALGTAQRSVAALGSKRLRFGSNFSLLQVLFSARCSCSDDKRQRIELRPWADHAGEPWSSGQSDGMLSRDRPIHAQPAVQKMQQEAFLLLVLCRSIHVWPCYCNVFLVNIHYAVADSEASKPISASNREPPTQRHRSYIVSVNMNMNMNRNRNFWVDRRRYV